MLSQSNDLTCISDCKIGFGCFGIPDDRADLWIREAIICGYRHFDCAFLYSNEAAIGKAIRKCIDQGLVTREEIFITSKLPMNGMSPKRVDYFLHKSLSNLNCDYLDLYLIHAPFAVKYISDDQFYPVNQRSGELEIDRETDLKETWEALERSVDNGLTRSIGVSNFNEDQITYLLSSCRIKPSASQNETHVYFQQKQLRSFCSRHGIAYQSFGPLGSTRNALAKGLQLVLDDPTIKQLANKYKVTSSQLMLRWHQQVNIKPIVGFDNVDHIRENISLDHFDLKPEDLSIIDKLDRNERIMYFDRVPGTRSHRYYPF